MSVPGSPSHSQDSGRSAASSFAQRRGWIGIAVGVLLLWLAFREVPISELRSALAGGEYVWLVPLAGLELVVLLGTALVLVFRQQIETVLARLPERRPGAQLRALLPRWRELVNGLAPLSRPKAVIQSVLLSAGVWGLYVLAYWCVLRAFRSDASVVEAAFMVIALWLAISLPSSPGFIGVFQFAGQQALVLPFGGKYDPRDRTGGNAGCLPGLVCPYELPGWVGHVENGGDLRRHRQTAHRLEGALGPTGCGRGGDRWRSSTKWAR